MQYTATYSSALGELTLASDGEALTGLWFEGQRYFGSTLSGECVEWDFPVFREAREWLDVYFSGRAPGFTPPLRFTGTAFRQEVWALLTAIPYGETRSYGELARELASKRGLSHMSARAVGSAVGRNPISMIVPCHRVVGSDGALTGYAGGVERKRALLVLEGADCVKR